MPLRRTHAIRHGRLLQLLKSFSGEGQLHRIGFSQSIAERGRPSCHRGAINMQNALLKPHQLKLFLSNKFVYAQVVRQADGRIVAAASSIEKALAEGLPSTSDKDACSKCAALTRTRNQRPPARLPSAPPNPPAPARPPQGRQRAGAASGPSRPGRSAVAEEAGAATPRPDSGAHNGHAGGRAASLHKEQGQGCRVAAGSGGAACRLARAEGCLRTRALLLDGSSRIKTMLQHNAAVPRAATMP